MGGQPGQQKAIAGLPYGGSYVPCGSLGNWRIGDGEERQIEKGEPRAHTELGDLRSVPGPPCTPSQPGQPPCRIPPDQVWQGEQPGEQLQEQRRQQ